MIDPHHDKYLENLSPSSTPIASIHESPRPFTDGTKILTHLPAVPDGPACFASEAPVRPVTKLDDIGPAPDGGREAWLCVLGAFFAVFCIFGFNTSVGQLSDYYLQHQLMDNNASQVGWISAIALFIVSSGSIVSGRYFDSHGTKRLALCGSVLCVVALIAIAFSQKYYQFLLSHAAVGVAGTMVYAPATAVVGQWFDKKRGTAVGIVVAGSGLGGVVYPIMIKRLIEELGFRHGMLVVAAMNAVLMTITCFTMRARLPPRTPPPLRDLRGPWSSPRYACLVIGSALVIMNWATPYFNAVVYATSNRATPTVSGYAIAILQSGSFVGRIMSGILGDRFGVWTIFTIMGIFSSLIVLCLWTQSSLPDGAVVFALLGYGWASGAWSALVAASCASISPVREYGMRLGMLWSITGLPALAGPVISGALVTADHGRFGYAAIFAGMTNLTGILIAVSPIIARFVAQRVLHRGKQVDAEHGGASEITYVESK